MKVEDYVRLKTKIDHLIQRKARAEGALEQAEKRLSKELGVSVAEASNRIIQLEKRAEQLRYQVEQQLEDFSGKWGEKLEDIK